MNCTNVDAGPVLVNSCSCSTFVYQALPSKVKPFYKSHYFSAFPVDTSLWPGKETESAVPLDTAMVVAGTRYPNQLVVINPFGADEDKLGHGL